MSFDSELFDTVEDAVDWVGDVAPPAVTGQPVLRGGDDGPDVETLQRQLHSLGFNPGAFDGDFGSRTEDAVQAFQASVGLPISGVVDDTTWAALADPAQFDPAQFGAHDDEAGMCYPPEGYEAGPSADRFVDICLAQVNDEYILGEAHSQEDKDNEDQDEFDCSGLVQWAMAQVGKDIGGNARMIMDRCTPISVQEAASIRGAVFFGPPRSPRSKTVSGHIGVSLGDGAFQIDAAASADRVTVRKILWKYWTEGGLLPGIVYPDRS